MFNFGQRLKQLRELKGMPQKQLAKALSVQQTTISFIENRPELPRTELLEKIIVFFDVDISFFKESAASAENKDEVLNYISHLAEIKTGGMAAHLNSKADNEREKLEKLKNGD